MVILYKAAQDANI